MEDIQNLHGAGGDESIKESASYSIFKPTPWLVVNLCNAFITVDGIHIFEKNCPVDRFGSLHDDNRPKPKSWCQNTGDCHQESRFGGISQGDSSGVILLETLKGPLSDIVIGFIVLIVTGIWSRNIRVGLVVFLTMILNMELFDLVRSLILTFLRCIKCDRAQNSYIFLPSRTSIAGMFIFLRIGWYFLL
jgi:Mg/Co/Ni transporter MgtE